MFVEERIYTLKPASVPEYIKAYETEGFKIQLGHLGNMVGYYFTEVGDLNVIVHMWAYESFEDRMKRRAALGADPAWRAYLAKVGHLLLNQKNRLMHPAPFFLPRLKTMLASVKA
ncbi:MAG: NIPSNAP family protein [Rhodospirillaceae bacterium]|nr:NIPSNAP family protein [Rhodospirillaceae bacterium]